MTEESFNNSTNNGKWGYKPSYYNSETNTSFLPSPTTTATTIDSTSTANTTAKSYTLGLAARADYTTPAGTYNKTFILTATTNPVNYVVEYNANSTDPTIQNIPATQSGSVTATSVKLSTNTPTRDKYNFTGWCTVLPTVSGSSDTCTGTGAISFNPGDDFGIDQTTTNTTTLYAMWERTVFTCTKEYRLQNADGSYPSTYTSDGSEEVTTGGTCTYSKTITDYQGDTGNDTASSGSVQNISANSTIQLDFPRNTYALTINKNNTYISAVSASTTPAESPNKFRWGQDVSISATLSQGEFAGWTQTSGTTGTFANNMNATTTFTMPNSNATIYADGDIKVQKPGKISYHPNVTSLSNIQGEMGDQAASNNEEVVLYAPNYKRQGYGFAGWNTSADGTGTTYGPNQSYTTASNFTTTGVMLYAKWVQSAGDLQGWNGCSSMDEGDVTALTDTRDNDTYAIAKLADGKCWMIENLRLADKDSNNNDINLSNLNTNNPSLPLTNTYDAANPTLSNHLSAPIDPTQTAWCRNSSAACLDQSMLATNSTTLFTNNTASNYQISGTNGNVYSYGNYYNWYSATAGHGKYEAFYQNQSTPGDICPIDWHLPTGSTGERNDSEFSMLDIGLGGTGYYSNNGTTPTGALMSEAYRSYPNNFIYSGFVGGLEITGRNLYGRYWSSTSDGGGTALGLYIRTDRILPGTNTDYSSQTNSGRSVRCLANNP